MTKHKHYEAIMAWANGAAIESFQWGTFKDCSEGTWMPDTTPYWHPDRTYRAKQAPKPDAQREVLLVNSLSAGPLLYAASPLECNCVLVFDGETNKLKGCTFKAA